MLCKGLLPPLILYFASKESDLLAIFKNGLEQQFFGLLESFFHLFSVQSLYLTIFRELFHQMEECFAKALSEIVSVEVWMSKKPFFRKENRVKSLKYAKLHKNWKENESQQVL